MKTLLLLFFFITPNQQTTLSEDEQYLLKIVNDYRIENNLPELKNNFKLTNTARRHIYQLKNIDPFRIPNFNLHSWINCNYDNNNDCMWNKPKELFNYQGTGYEIITYNSKKMTADKALNNFKSSSGHNDIILNKEEWKRVDFTGVGIAINNNYCAIWFGDE